MLAVMGRVRPALGFLPPARRPWLLAVAPPIARLYLRTLGIRRLEVRGGEKLVRLYQDLEQQRCRLLVAFRHSSVCDAAVMFNLLSRGVAREARRLGVRLRRPPRGLFTYDRAMLEWAGRWLAWAFPRMGMISVFPGKLDSPSVAAVRAALLEAPHPVAIAPEGQVSFHDRQVAELEPGAARLALWCLEDLRRSGRSEAVVVLPVSLHYACRQADWKRVDQLLGRTERECGLLAPPGAAPADGSIDRCHRVLRVLDRLLAIAESWYTRFHGLDLPAARDGPDPDSLQRRLDAVTQGALDAADRLFGLPAVRSPQGDRRTLQAHWLERVTSGRYTGYARIYRPDIGDVGRLSGLERSLAERASAEAWLALRHVELAGILAFMRPDYLAADSPVERYVELATNLWDVANRLKGGDISGRVSISRRVVRAIVGEPIPVTEVAGRNNRREAVAALTEAIRTRFVEASREE